MTTELQALQAENKLLGEVIAKLAADRKELLKAMQEISERIIAQKWEDKIDATPIMFITRAAIAKVQE